MSAAVSDGVDNQGNGGNFSEKDGRPDFSDGGIDPFLRAEGYERERRCEDRDGRPDWYGSKQELFRSMVAENAREVAELLRASIASGRKPVDALQSIGPVLLRLLINEKAIALNRAAVMDSQETGILGRTLAEAGRDSVMPLIAEVFGEWRTGGHRMFESKEEAAEIYIRLLVGDLQIRRAIGVLGPLKEAELRRRAARALQLVQRLASPGLPDR